jgi:hypothetical protein
VSNLARNYFRVADKPAGKPLELLNSYTRRNINAARTPKLKLRADYFGFTPPQVISVP